MSVSVHVCGHNNHLASLLKDFCKSLNPIFRFISQLLIPWRPKCSGLSLLYDLLVFSKAAICMDYRQKHMTILFHCGHMLSYYAYLLFVLLYPSLQYHPMFELIFMYTKLVSERSATLQYNFGYLFASLLPHRCPHQKGFLWEKAPSAYYFIYLLIMNCFLLLTLCTVVKIS